MAKRKSINLTTKLAAALLALGHIDYEESKRLSAKQIIRRYDFDHWPILHALGGPDLPWNLRPLLKAPHREKSRKDAGVVAKVKRLQGPRCKHCCGDGVGCCAGALSETFNKGPRHAPEEPARAPVRVRGNWPKPKRKIASRAFPWPPRGTRPFRCKKATPERRV